MIAGGSIERRRRHTIAESERRGFWGFPSTLGAMSTPDKLLNSWFHSVMPRTAGFNSVDIASLRDTTRLLTETLMFIGGGSASTAGGIKVSTFALLGFVMWAEARGDPDVAVFGRRVPSAAQRQAVSVALLAIGAVVASNMVLMAASGHARLDVLQDAARLPVFRADEGWFGDAVDPAMLQVSAIAGSVAVANR